MSEKVSVCPPCSSADLGTDHETQPRPHGASCPGRGEGQRHHEAEGRTGLGDQQAWPRHRGRVVPGTPATNSKSVTILPRTGWGLGISKMPPN